MSHTDLHVRLCDRLVIFLPELRAPGSLADPLWWLCHIYMQEERMVKAA